MYKNIAEIYEQFGWGEFSEKLFKKLKPLILKWQIKSHLDLACGTGIFVARMAELGIATQGVDGSKAMIRLAKKHYPPLKFKTSNMVDFSLVEPVELITCNFDSINHLAQFSDWQKVFSNAYMSLTKRGRFLFDINTLKAINGTDQTSDEVLGDLHLAKKTYSQNGKLVFDLRLFEQKKNGMKERFVEIIEEVSFPFKQIKAELMKCGFRKVSLINNSINKTSNLFPERKSRLYILAEK